MTPATDARIHSPALHYHARIQWTGNTGRGTARYDAYSRDHAIHIDGKAPLAASALTVARPLRARPKTA